MNTQESRRFITHLIENNKTDSELTQLALAMAFGTVLVHEFKGSDEFSDLNQAIYDRIYPIIAKINSQIIIRYDINELTLNVRDFLMTRWCVSGLNGRQPHVNNTSKSVYPLAALFGIGTYLGDSTLELLSNPEMSTLVVGWINVIECNSPA